MNVSLTFLEGNSKKEIRSPNFTSVKALFILFDFIPTAKMALTTDVTLFQMSQRRTH